MFLIYEVFAVMQPKVPEKLKECRSGMFSVAVLTAEQVGIVAGLAPIKGDELMVSEGMIGGINGTLIRGTESFVIKEGSLFNTYIGRDTRFCGIQQETEIILEDGTVLYAVTLVPEDHYIKEDAANRIIWGIAMAILFVAMLFISFLLAKNFVKPIAQSLEAIQEDDFAGAGSSGISEIDSLLSFIRKKGSGKSETNLTSDIEELFSDFAKRAEALTPAERSIIKYYADGKEVSEIPELCFISINTVRKHNSNIYRSWVSVLKKNLCFISNSSAEAEEATSFFEKTV